MGTPGLEATLTGTPALPGVLTGFPTPVVVTVDGILTEIFAPEATLTGAPTLAGPFTGSLAPEGTLRGIFTPDDRLTGTPTLPGMLTGIPMLEGTVPEIFAPEARLKGIAVPAGRLIGIPTLAGILIGVFAPEGTLIGIPMLETTLPEILVPEGRLTGIPKLDGRLSVAFTVLTAEVAAGFGCSLTPGVRLRVCCGVFPTEGEVETGVFPWSLTPDGAIFAGRIFMPGVRPGVAVVPVSIARGTGSILREPMVLPVAMVTRAGLADVSTVAGLTVAPPVADFEDLLLVSLPVVVLGFEVTVLFLDAAGLFLAVGVDVAVELRFDLCTAWLWRVRSCMLGKYTPHCVHRYTALCLPILRFFGDGELSLATLGTDAARMTLLAAVTLTSSSFSDVASFSLFMTTASGMIGVDETTPGLVTSSSGSDDVTSALRLGDDVTLRVFLAGAS